ncbi:MAG: delta-60 repeat domain-containing protein [Verrucomicrobia bacterium]|nr:delta-60 repeat domain-containing protein [Verrucomicrobiota bacterium]
MSYSNSGRFSRLAWLLCVVAWSTTAGAATPIIAGSLDTSFKPGKVMQQEADGIARGSVHSIACLPDGRILIGGLFDQAGGTNRHNIARLRANGSADPTFAPWDGPDADDPQSLAIQVLAPAGGGKYYVGGAFTTYDLADRPCLVRILANGQLDSSFNAGIFDPVYTAAPAIVRSLALRKNLLIVGGQFKGPKKPSADRRQYCLQGLALNGQLDMNFANSNYPIEGYNAVLPLPDGNILVGSATTLTFLDANGDVRFDEPNRFISIQGGVTHLLLQPDGKILLAGSYLREVRGIAVSGLARLLPSGLLDPSFQPASITSTANRLIRAVALQRDGKIIVGGLFDRVGGVRRYSIARLHPTGTLDTTFDSREVSDVTAIAVQADGKILVGEYFRYETSDPYYQNSQIPMGIKRLNNEVCPVGPLVQPKSDTPPYDESCLTAEMSKAVALFETAVKTNKGASIVKTSACRTAKYQAHLYEIWSNAKTLTNWSGVKVVSREPLQFELIPGSIASASVIFELNEEIRSHFPKSFPPTVAVNSPHSVGIAVDWSVLDLKSDKIDDLAESFGLVRNVRGERWHFALTSASSRKRCVFRGKSPVAILVQDPQGRRVGYDPVSGTVVNEIGPFASYSGLDSSPQEVEILPEAVVYGDYRVSSVGTGSGPYTIEIQVFTEDDSGDVAEEVLATGTAQDGQALPAIPPINCVASSARLDYRLTGGNLKLTAPDWATNAAVEYSYTALPGSWQTLPQALDARHSLVVTNSGERSKFFRLRIK